MNAKLQDLIAAWIAAKNKENEVKAHRLALEEQILSMVPAKEEGTVKLDQLKITFKLNRKLASEDLLAAWPTLGNAQHAVRWKADLNLREFKTLPEASLLLPFMTTTPAKPSFALIGEPNGD